MKKKMIGNLISLAAVLGVLVVGTPTSAAQTFLGNFCGWYNVENPPCVPSLGEICLVGVFYPLRVGVTHLGGAYFLLQGMVTELPDNPLVLQATGVLVDNEVWLNGSSTHDHAPTQDGTTVREGGPWQARLAVSTLSGPFWSIQTEGTITEGFTATFSQKYVRGNLVLNHPCFVVP